MYIESTNQTKGVAMLIDNLPASELQERDRISVLGDPVAGVIRIVRQEKNTHVLYRDFESGHWTVNTFTDDDYFEVKR